MPANLGDTSMSSWHVCCLPETLSFEDMLSSFSFVRCCFSSQSCRLVRLELQLRFFRLSQEECQKPPPAVHEFSFFIACSSSCRIGPTASSFSIFWFVRERTLDGVMVSALKCPLGHTGVNCCHVVLHVS
ncbi:hypothetical protein Bca4012_077812 [Brassica carinata]